MSMVRIKLDNNSPQDATFNVVAECKATYDIVDEAGTYDYLSGSNNDLSSGIKKKFLDSGEYYVIFSSNHYNNFNVYNFNENRGEISYPNDEFIVLNGEQSVETIQYDSYKVYKYGNQSSTPTRYIIKFNLKSKLRLLSFNI